MNNILTLSQLITRLSKVTGTDTGTARRFLRTFFAMIEDTLAAGEDVEIKGIGTFRRSTDPTFGAPGGVAFIPDSELAAEINSPFAMFEAVELADGLTFDQPEETDPKPETIPEPEPEPEPVPVPEPEPEPAPEPEPEIIPEPIEEPSEQTAEEPEMVSVHPDAATSITYKWPEEEEAEEAEAEANELTAEAAHTDLSDESDEDTDSETEENKGSRLWLWIIIGILAGAGIGLAAAFLATPRPDYGYSEEPETVEESVPTTTDEEPMLEEIDVTDAVMQPQEATPVQAEPAAEPKPQQTQTTADTKEQPAKPAKAEPRYDTVTKSRYLATMAREYYGRGIFWVFIYEANADHLDNPDKIRPGTRVVIPERSSFPADLNEAQRLAEKKQAEIRKKYGK